MVYGTDGRGSIPRLAKGYYYSLQRPYRLWGPASLLSVGYRRLFLGDKVAGA
jgi:hypothetical protein